MGCGCGGATDEVFVVDVPGSGKVAVDSEEQARATVTASGGGTWNRYVGASATEIRRTMEQPAAA